MQKSEGENLCHLFPETPEEWEEVRTRNVRERALMFRLIRSIVAYTQGQDQANEWDEITAATQEDVFSLRTSNIQKLADFVKNQPDIRQLFEYMVVPEKDLQNISTPAALFGSDEDRKRIRKLERIKDMSLFLNDYLTLQGDFGKQEDEWVMHFGLGHPSQKTNLDALKSLGKEHYRAVNARDYSYGAIFLVLSQGFTLEY